VHFFGGLATKSTTSAEQIFDLRVGRFGVGDGRIRSSSTYYPILLVFVFSFFFRGFSVMNDTTQKIQLNLDSGFQHDGKYRNRVEMIFGRCLVYEWKKLN
jgi:hypothetical protein